MVRIDRSGASAVQLQQRQNAADLQRRLRGFHPADLGFVLEGLEPDDRLQIWTALEPRQAAEAIVEIDASVRAWLIGETPKHRLVKIAEALDPDDLAWISDDLPEDVMRQVRESLGEIDRTLLQQADAYPPQSVGRLMSLDVATVREAQTMADVLRDLQARAELPDHLDRLFVVDARNLLRGAVEPAIARRRAPRDVGGQPSWNAIRWRFDRPTWRQTPRARSSATISCRCRSSTIAASSSGG